MDRKQKLELRYLLAELREQESILTELDNGKSDVLKLKGKIIRKLIEDEGHERESLADLRGDATCRKWRTQIMQEQKAIQEQLEEIQVKIENAHGAEIQAKIEIAEARIEIIKGLIKDLGGDTILGKLDELETENILTEYIEKKLSGPIENSKSPD